MNKKRWIAALLALCCTFSMVPAMAADTEENIDPMAKPRSEWTESDDYTADNDTFQSNMRVRGDEVISRSWWTSPYPIYSNKSSGGSDWLTRSYQLPEGYNVYHGIDVSKWNNSIDWNKAKAAGTDFAIIRAGYRSVSSSGGLYKDPKFDTYMKGAEKAGVPVGVYIFSQAVNQQEAVEEANYVLKLIQGYDVQLEIVMDYEFYDGGRLNEARDAGKLTKRVATDNVLAFCNTIRNAGYQPMVYASKSFFESVLYPDEISDVCTGWLAHYLNNENYTYSSYKGDYDYWQYSSQGSVNGVGSEYVDVNFCIREGKLTDVYNSEKYNRPFTDVVSSDWFYDAVTYAYNNKLMNGMGDGSFMPEKTLTRAEAIQVLYNYECAEKGVPTAAADAGFTDNVPDWAKTAVNWGYAAGIVKGVSTEGMEFGANTEVSRQDFMTMLYRYLNNGAEPEQKDVLTDKFTDSSNVAAYAANAFNWAVNNGIINGMGDGTLCPQNSTKRSETAKILSTYVQHLKAANN